LARVIQIHFRVCMCLFSVLCLSTGGHTASCSKLFTTFHYVLLSTQHSFACFRLSQPIYLHATILASSNHRQSRIVVTSNHMLHPVYVYVRNFALEVYQKSTIKKESWLLTQPHWTIYMEGWLELKKWSQHGGNWRHSCASFSVPLRARSTKLLYFSLFSEQKFGEKHTKFEWKVEFWCFVWVQI
jgi:hypothetical protein